jgi:hypothetical protein
MSFCTLYIKSYIKLIKMINDNKHYQVENKNNE